MFVSIDGNNIGKELEKYILNNDLEKLENFSSEILNNIGLFKSIIEKYSGKIYMIGGDNLLAYYEENVEESILNEIEEKKKCMKYEYAMGIGNTPVLAYLALKKSKENLQNEIVKCYLKDEDIIFIII